MDEKALTHTHNDAFGKGGRTTAAASKPFYTSTLKGEPGI